MKNTHHFIDVSENGETKVDFSLDDLPSGTHIIYIISEKVIDNNLKDHLEKKQNQEVFSANHFSLEIDKKKIDKNERFKPVENIEDSYQDERISLRLYEDKKLTTEVSSVEDTNYYLMFNNPSENEISGVLKLLKDYSAETLDRIKVPANSKIMIPVKLKNLEDIQSIRFLLLAQPNIKDTVFPLRTIKFSQRIPVK
ncbi:MAG TPA: hypothetical protein GXX18_05885 [Bacillales bacterium]|nr:hypothetical protein [Bacillales bacterium]